MLAAIVVPIGPSLASDRPIQSPIDNPDLDKACGLNVLMILDESSSIRISHAQNHVRDAFKAFTGAIKNTSSSMAVAKFGTTAQLPTIGGFPAGEYITVTDATKTALDHWVDTGYDPPHGPPYHYTNWEDGLRMGNFSFAPRPTQAVPHLTVFITDGDPNRVVRDSVSQHEYENDLLDDWDMSSTSENHAADKAVANANGIKGQQSHVLAIAVGSGVSSSASLDRLKKISGPDVYSGVGDFDIATDDIYRVSDFSDLEEALREAAFQLCAPSVTIEKLVDMTPDPNSIDDAIPGVGWTITGTVDAPGSGVFDWVLPQGATGSTATDQTDGAGFVTFQWNTHEAGTSGFEAVETIQSGFTNDQSHTACTFRTPDDPDDQPLPITVSDGRFTGDIPTESIVTCTFVNIADPAPSIDIEKATNGADADAAPGPAIPVGDTVNWTYVVTNTGNTTLDGISVHDDQGLTVTCPHDTLGHGESMTCTASGTAATGQYENLGDVFAVDSHGTHVSDRDPSHYFGDEPGLDIEKATNTQDADHAPGPLVVPGSTVTWDYVVTNTSATFDIESITVVDETHTSGGVVVSPPTSAAVTCPNTTLAAGASMTCTARTDTAIAGQYENIATVTGIADPGGSAVPVSASDPSHYFAVVGSVNIEKATNGADADDPTGPRIRVGDPVHWTYIVTNTGNTPLTSWSVSDSQGVAVACPRVVLMPGVSQTCSATGTAQSGQYANIGTVTAANPLGGDPLTDSDPSHYIGVEPSLDLEKATNGADADQAPGPYIPVGGGVTWTYVVTNNGDTELTNLQVEDNQVGPITCPDTTLLAGESVTCTATGTAQVGQYENLALAIALDPFGTYVGDLDPSHYFGATPGIRVEKHTNGVDADTAPGPYVPYTDPVTWTYEVTNTGSDTLTDITLVDDVLGSVTCPQTALPAGASMVCTVTGTASTLGHYENEAEVSGTDGVNTVTDTDPSHYFGYVSEIHVEKATNGQDADTATGPQILVGDPVTWTYVVTNPGNVDIHHVSVTDDMSVTPVYQSGDDGDSILQPGETWTYTATGIAVAGQYENLATADGRDALEDPVQDTDPSHYFGVDPAIHIEKATNGEDADTAPGPRLPAGNVVNWTYVVTNAGNVPLGTITVTDNVVGVTPVYQSGDTNGDDLLDLAETWTYTAAGTAAPDQYENIGTATGSPPIGNPVSDTDPSHYFGTHPNIDIEKATSASATGPWDDADAPTGPYIVVGGTVYWQYVVKNTGNVDLTGITVTDNRGVTVSCPETSLPADDGQPGGPDEMTCTASGTAVAGQYKNIAVASGTDDDLQTVVDADPSHYFGSNPSIVVEKWTNGEDADSGPGPYVPVGDSITWTYMVATSGNVPLHDVGVTDDTGVIPVFVPASDTNGNSLLDPGEVWVYMVGGTAVAGQYENVATAVGTGPAGTDVTDTDPSHYFGTAPAVDIEKATNGEDADTATGPYLAIGDAVTWTYVVENTGNVGLTGVTVTDDQGVAVTCPQTTIAVGGSMTCTASDIAVAGQYENLGTVEAVDLAGSGASATDPSHYFGADASIGMEKWTNHEDADTPTGPYIPVGDAVRWVYLVHNDGNVPLDNVTVTDDQGVTPTFLGGDTNADGLLDPRELWVYEATGTAVAGQYTNVGTATGTPPGGLPPVADTDPSNYFGMEASIDIQKTPDVTYLQSGSDHEFTIAVTNTSNVTLTDVVVTDPLVPACDADSGRESGLASMAPGVVVSYTCTVANVTTVIDNIADVDGVAPNRDHVVDSDNALVAPWNVAGTGSIGDTVWRDVNSNGIQDAGEVGVAGARVRVIYLDGTGTEAEYTTDGNGWYLAVGLVAGNYRVEIDTTSVDAGLTTPSSFTFYLLDGEEHLDADFGINETLPVTGADIARHFGFGLTLVALGVLLLFATRRRDRFTLGS